VSPFKGLDTQPTKLASLIELNYYCLKLIMMTVSEVDVREI
jgi:hypothetical protein